MLGTALALAGKGLAVFPCMVRDKRPATPDGLKSATRDVSLIRHWWGLQPNYNVAVACGVVSGIFVIDVDGLDAELELRKLEKDHGELPPTVEVVTPRPGRHIYFRHPGVSVRNSASRIAPGVDTRGDGGYVLCPPSVHPSGKAYAWSVDSASAFAAAPQWLLERMAERTNGNGAARPTPPSEWRALMADGVPEGQRDSTLARITGYLLRHHIDPVFAAGFVEIFNTARCLPPLPEKDVARIVNSIAGKELKRRGGNGQ
jgi:Bifunctional DNA primase/polymerase, N-terminal/Primase C terminal 1 (PriCT-1)